MMEKRIFVYIFTSLTYAHDSVADEANKIKPPNFERAEQF